MEKQRAIELANRKARETGQEHFVVREPNSILEVITRSGYVVKSETQMKTDYGSVEEILLNVVYSSRLAS